MRTCKLTGLVHKIVGTLKPNLIGIWVQGPNTIRPEYIPDLEAQHMTGFRVSCFNPSLATLAPGP